MTPTILDSYLGRRLLYMRALMNKRIAGIVCPNAITSRNQRIKRLATTTNQEMAGNKTIKLNEVELKLFNFLRDIVEQSDCNVTLRVAGGWVRDKLLGLDSSDIDIALDTITGSGFAQFVNKYEKEHGGKTHSIGVIKVNPEQSKHLETITMKFDDIGWVDFVNLRSETYSKDHRIPDVQFGTPQEDAERRDFTINSLFYNISNDKIEDFTERGIGDLKKGIIRTPLDSRVTFLDDPLRVLRAIRFASRFNFKLDENLRQAAQLDDVKDALIQKVSRERVGKELLGMLEGPSAHPQRAFTLMHELGLFKCVFLVPQQSRILDENAKNVPSDIISQKWDHAYKHSTRMHQYLNTRNDCVELEIDKMNEAKRHRYKLRILASFLCPLSSFDVMESNKKIRVPYYIIKESLKLRNRDAGDIADTILANCGELRNLVHEKVFDRVKTGLLLRKVGSLWKVCRDVACISDMVENCTTSQSPILAKYDSLTTFVATSNLQGVWSWKPLMTGSDVIQVLGISPGPDVKKILDEIIVWQLEDPDRTYESCVEHFKRLYSSATNKIEIE
uniref:tRNA nucleotidyltransferase putative n=1 Tax=Albugo laibachii Nc14 TaxID=890382 RepID=F0W871_9STRA|nr:tRNA nucleotidyltransferase putative [Albugo laibachii Nc14]|eukprot:CCA17355.1 tRNA nucleotidyltransferase putative [Albugo laibachii Nc14]